MALALTAEDLVRRIAAECASVDERGGVGIRLKPAAAIVRQRGEHSSGHRGKRGRSLWRIGHPFTHWCPFLHDTGWTAVDPHRTFGARSATPETCYKRS